MRISFDIDDTLIFYDKSKNGNDRLLNGEYLRPGALSLLKELQKDHELWIYTASLRRPRLLKFSFLLKGIRIAQVINQDEHLRLQYQLNLPNFPTKFPSKFGIDLHIDDSEGVEIEAAKFCFNMLRIDTEDSDWTNTVKKGIRQYTVNK